MAENEQNWKAADWQRYRHQRVLILWEVVALSLGADPDKRNIAEAMLDQEFQRDYAQRIKVLTRMVSAVPTPGYVTFFPSHEYNKGKLMARNRMVDVVSCIDKLVKTDKAKLPKEFVALRVSLKRVPISEDLVRTAATTEQRPSSVLRSGSSLPVETASSIEPAEVAIKPKDQSKAARTKHDDTLAILFYAVVRDAYGYDATEVRSEKKAAEDIEKALEHVVHRQILGHGNRQLRRSPQQCADE